EAVVGKHLRLRLSRGAGKARVEKQIPLVDEASIDYQQLVETLEEKSRGEFIEFLKAAGYSGRPARPKSSEPVSPQVEDLLSELNFTSHLLALRALHSGLESQGESPALLGAVVRAYSNLGRFTQFHWNAAHKVFKARALLYAQRLVSANPSSSWALWH